MKAFRKRKWNLLTLVMLLNMVLSQMAIAIPTASADGLELLITGSGVKEEVAIGDSDWSKYTLKESIYSANNSLGFHKIIKAKGYDLFELIGKDNLKTDKDYNVKFTCADGFEFEKSISELQNVYQYKDFTEKTKKKIGPMIAKYTAVLADYPKNKFSPPITFTDRPINEDDLDKDFPKLVFGQDGIDDMNLSKWGKQVIKITIGDEIKDSTGGQDSTYKHISYDGAPYNIDAISGATFTVEGPGVEGYRAISLRQIEEEVSAQETVSYYEKTHDGVVENTYEGINVEKLIEKFVKVKENAGNLVFKNKSRQVIKTVPIGEAKDYTVAYGINEVPYVYLDSDVGYREDKYNDNGCFKLVYKQDKASAKEFSNVAYIYIEEKDAKNIFEHTYEPYNDEKYTDYEIIIHGDGVEKETRYTVSEIEAMKDIQYTDEYSLSNSEYFWYYNNYKGVTLWDLLLKAGVDKNISEKTEVKFITADNYNFAPLTIKEIKDNSLYGYYEKDAEDLGDGKFDGNSVEPLKKGQPPLLAYGFNGYPYVTRPSDDGYNPGLGNDGGPLRIIFGKTGYNDTNGSNQVQFIKEIIVGKGNPISATDLESGGDSTLKPVDKDSSWNHNRDVFKEYLDLPVLRVTGSQVKEPMTFTLRQIESLTQYALRDVYTGDGILEFEGIQLWDIISKVVGLKDGVDNPSIRVFSGQNYNQVLRSLDQVKEGVMNSKGQNKKIILAYAVEGYPLVPNESSIGYVNNNAYGPLRLLIEENKSMWVKWTDCIVVGTGDYEEPKIEDVKDLDLPELEEVDEIVEGDKIWLTYRNDTGLELQEASVRAMEYDHEGNLWISTNNGGTSFRSPDGKWTLLKSVETTNRGQVEFDTSYAIIQRENGELWMTLGRETDAKGILVKDGQEWRVIDKENSPLPACFVQELEFDGMGGLWIGTRNGLAHIDADDNWTVLTQEDGLLALSVDAVQADEDGGVWLGYYPGVEGDENDQVYKGGYQYISKDGQITTYEGFDENNFNVNWTRSISIDAKGGVWIVRSGNAPGFSKGEIDYIFEGERKVYMAKDIYKDIADDNDVRLLKAHPENADTLYMATTSGGLIEIDLAEEKYTQFSGDNVFPSKQWNNVYFLDFHGEDIFIGTNGGAGIYTTAMIFKDAKDHWANGEISQMATKGYIKGSDGSFRPDENITRAEFVSLIARIKGLDLNGQKASDFKDVADSAWYAKSVGAVLDAGYVKGYPDNTFRPNAYITRQEIAHVIGSLIDTQMGPSKIDSLLSIYKDEVPDWAKLGAAKATDKGIIKGLSKGVFGGGENATRAQVAVMLLRFLR